jgi:hypothetical protein
MRRSTMYTDVPLCDASSSRGVPGCTKFVTSAISIMHPETDQGIKSPFCVLRWADWESTTHKVSRNGGENTQCTKPFRLEVRHKNLVHQSTKVPESVAKTKFMFLWVLQKGYAHQLHKVHLAWVYNVEHHQCPCSLSYRSNQSQVNSKWIPFKSHWQTKWKQTGWALTNWVNTEDT